MKRSILYPLALAAGLAASIGAQAQTYYRVEPARPVIVERQYGPPAYAYDSREFDVHHRHRCDASRWDPNHRYMPGEVVRRNGETFVATEASRHVYNVNSPPEWTPNYWAPARCR